MSAPHPILIDFNEAGLDLEQPEMEEFLLNIADELQSGDLVQDARLARESDIPEAAKPGIAAFLTGILTAEISRENIRKVIDFLGHQFYGKTLTLSGEMDGMSYSIEYRNQADIDQAIDTIERLSNLRIKIQNKQEASES